MNSLRGKFDRMAWEQIHSRPVPRGEFADHFGLAKSGRSASFAELEQVLREGADFTLSWCMMLDEFYLFRRVEFFAQEPSAYFDRRTRADEEVTKIERDTNKKAPEQCSCSSWTVPQFAKLQRLSRKSTPDRAGEQTRTKQTNRKEEQTTATSESKPHPGALGGQGEASSPVSGSSPVPASVQNNAPGCA